MHEIKCPKCGTTFKIDEASYAEVLKQVHNAEFDREIATKMAEVAKINQKDLELAKQQVINDYEQRTARQEQEIQKLQSELSGFEDAKRADLAKMQNQLDHAEADKNAIVAKMQNQLDRAEADKKAAVAKMQGELDNAEIEKKVSCYRSHRQT